MSEQRASDASLLPVDAGVQGAISVRMWERADAAALNDAVAVSREHLSPWMPWAAQPPMSVEEREHWIAETRVTRAAGGDAVYGIFSGSDVTGACGLHRRIGPGGLEIGYWVHAGWLRRGIATSAARILTAAAFSLPEIDRVEIHHDQANAASGRVAAAAGYTFVAAVPDEPEAPGEIGIECRWRLSRPRSGSPAA